MKRMKQNKTVSQSNFIQCVHINFQPQLQLVKKNWKTKALVFL